MDASQDTSARSRARARLAALSVAAVVILAAATVGAWELIVRPGPTAHGPAKPPASRPGLTVRPPAERPPVDAASTDPDTAAFTEVTVTRVVDGDTIHVQMPDGTTEKVRFIGVNTPESTTRHEPYGAEASAYAKRRLPKGLKIWLEVDVALRDKYGRMLAYVWLERPSSITPQEIRAKMFNAELLIEGYAQLMTIPPDVRYVDVFTPLQAEARDADRGLWGLPAK
jgi:micrococcal nuclease